MNLNGTLSQNERSEGEKSVKVDDKNEQSYRSKNFGRQVLIQQAVCFFLFEIIYFHSLRTSTLSLFRRLFWLFWSFIFDFRTVRVSLLECPLWVFWTATSFSTIYFRSFGSSIIFYVMFSSVPLYRPCFVFWRIQFNTWPTTFSFLAFQFNLRINMPKAWFSANA